MSSEMKRLRIIKCINAATIAEKVGMSRQRYSYIESKSIKTLKESTIRKIAETLSCDVYELADISQYLTVEPKNKQELDSLLDKIKIKYGKE